MLEATSFACTARRRAKRRHGHARLTRFIAAGPRTHERREARSRPRAASTTRRVRRQRTTAGRRRIAGATASPAVTWRHQHGRTATSRRRVHAAVSAACRRVSLPDTGRVPGARRRLTADDDRGTVGRKLFEQEDDGKALAAARRRVDWIRESGRDPLTVTWTAGLAHTRRTPVPAPATIDSCCTS